MGLKKVGIVGGGAAGALVAINLLRAFETGDEVMVFEPSLDVGRGVPYGTADPMHLLNVRASNMSAFVDQPSHFADWYANLTGMPVERAALEFAPRVCYGQYVGELLASTAAASLGRLTVIRERAAEVERSTGLVVKTASGVAIEVDELVLATGHLSPQTPWELQEFEGHEGYVRDPWRPGALGRIGARDSVLILGTGLTMVDLIGSLARRAHTGKIYARSRRGLRPHRHQPGTPVPLEISSLDGHNLAKSVIRLLREAGSEWRAVMDGMRPHTQELWDRLTWEDRRRFIQKLRPFWDVHRHRVPVIADEILNNLVDLGHLDIGKGRIDQIRYEHGEFKVRINGEELSVNWILNGTGPNLQLAKAKIPILESIVAQGLATYDPLGLGLQVDEGGRTNPGAHVWALGPLCRGSRWETTAIPEIRAQAARIASMISPSRP